MNRSDEAPAVVHFCRDIEYCGGVEHALYAILLYEHTCRHTLVMAEGVPGKRCASLRSLGVQVHHLSGDDAQKRQQLEEIGMEQKSPLLHCHLFGPEQLGSRTDSFRKRLTTKHCTYAIDRRSVAGTFGPCRRWYANLVAEVATTKRFDLVLAVSEEIAHRWRRLGLNVVLTPMGVIQDDELGVPRKPRIPKNEVRLIAVGRLVEEKQFTLIADALQKVKFGFLQIVGRGPECAQIRERFRKHGISDVNMTGRVPRSNVLRLMDEADALILPSRTEGFPLVIQEALSRGLPVVAMDVGGVSSLINEGCGVLVRAKTAQGLARGIELIKTRDTGRMSAACIEQCKKTCMLHPTVDRLSRIYTFLWNS